MGDEALRRAFEAGHRAKFLAIVDGTPECSRAVLFAARRALRLEAGLVLLAVTEPPDDFEWLGVGDALRAEAEEETAAQLAAMEALARSVGAEPERVQRLGDRADEILALIAEDEDIAFLVLAAGLSKEGPGPLVTGIAGKAATAFPIPVVIVPGGLGDAAIEALTG